MTLSITEYTVLGIVSRDGPCTTYHAMKELAASPSTFYRYRAATTYRSVQRMVDAGLIEQVGEDAGSRGERRLRITPNGTQVLEDWLAPPLPQVEVAHTIDLIRLRMYFVGALSTAKRTALLENALGCLAKHLDTIEAEMAREEQAGDQVSALASLGSVYETKARIEWLKEVKSRTQSHR